MFSDIYTDREEQIDLLNGHVIQKIRGRNSRFSSTTNSSPARSDQSEVSGIHFNIWAATWQYQQNEYAPSEDSDQPGHPPSLSAWASSQSDQSLRYLHEETLGPWLPTERTAKTLIRLGGWPGWSESSLGAHSFCWFYHVVAHLTSMTLLRWSVSVHLPCLLRLEIRRLDQTILKRQKYWSRLMTKTTKWHVRPAKTQISLGVHPVWSESSLCAQ